MQRRSVGRGLGAVLFTDIVGSTTIAAEMGNSRWGELVSRHHRLIRREIRRFGGREQDTAGFTECDRIFHELIVDGAGNAVLSAIYRTLRERQTLFTSVMVRGRGDRMDAAIAEHDRIIERLRADDADAFAGVVNEHLVWSTNLARESR